MGIDHALLAAVQHGAGPVLRLYRWQPACLSFGRNQHTLGIYDAERLRAAGVDVVRRPTGGLAVLHDDELTYAVVAPADALGGPKAAYLRINRALVAGLAALGVPAAIASAAGGPDPRHDAASPCFQAPAEGEVIAAGRKLVGSAQRCERRVILQHGSILLDGSQEDVLDYLAASRASRDTVGLQSPIGAPAAPGATTLRELLGRAPAAAAVASAIATGFEKEFGTRLALSGLSVVEAAESARLSGFYEETGWTWRR
jgi:lipoyl(octanoyl) transferase